MHELLHLRVPNHGKLFTALMSVHVPAWGDQGKVNSYIDERGLQRNALFAQILQALIELDEAGSEEHSILEALSSHVKDRDRVIPTHQGQFDLD